MHSAKLKQIVRLELDAAGMRGPVRRNDIAELIYGKHRETLFSEADRRDAWVRYLMAGIAEEMREPMNEDYLLTHIAGLPIKYLPLLNGLPRWICVNPSGVHVMAIRATVDDWESNARIKHALADAVKVKADQSSDIRRLLAAEGATSLEHLIAAKGG